MAEHFLVRFTRTHHIETDAGVAGWSPARIKIDGVERIGRVFKPTKENSGMYTEQLAELKLPVKQTKRIPLSPILQRTKDGKEWLKSFYDNLTTQYGKTADPSLEIRINEFPMQHVYTLYPKGWLDDDTRQDPPDGLLMHIPITAVFGYIDGASTFTDGKRIPNVFYNRKAIGANKEVMGVSVRRDTREIDYGDGSSIIGLAGEDDILIDRCRERVKGFFPAYHSVEMVWPTHIHAPESIYPVTIAVTMVM